MSGLTSDTRSYHTTSNAYPLPNDAPEHERLFLQTQAINAMMKDDPLRAPVKNPQRILEIGPGTGHMTNYVAEKFPDASEIIGLDLSPVPLPPAHPNVRFVQGDFFEVASDPSNETFKDGSFDYIFCRMLVFGIKDYPGYIARAKQLLAPGGWLEIQDLDFAFHDIDRNDISTKTRWINDQRAAFLERGIDIFAGRKFGGYFKDAGFVDIQPQQFRWVHGKWLGHPETDMMGRYATTYLLAANAGAYRKILGPSKTEEELEEDIKEMGELISYDETGKNQTYYVVCGKNS